MAVTVNGQRIDEAVLNNEFNEIKAYFERLGNVSCCERDPEFRNYARDNIVARMLLAQEAKRQLPPIPEPEIDAALAKVIENYGGEMQFYAATGARPDHMDLVRHDIDADLRVKRMMDQMCSDIVIAEDDLRRYHQEHQADYMTIEEVRASHILKSPKRGEERAGAYDALRQVRKQLQAGADFDALAAQHSDKAQESIDLGWFKRGELTEEFELVALSMDVGEISPVFCTMYGFHLVKLTDRRPSVPKPFETVREEVRAAMIEQTRQERGRKLVEQLKTIAVIEETADEEISAV